MHDLQEGDIVRIEYTKMDLVGLTDCIKEIDIKMYINKNLSTCIKVSIQ